MFGQHCLVRGTLCSRLKRPRNAGSSTGLDHWPERYQYQYATANNSYSISEYILWIDSAMNSMDKLDLNLMPIALALYDELSVSRAAQKLGMSQPAVSMALRKLRVAFNDPLFIRAAKGITPTPRAHALVRAARPLLTGLQESVLAEEHFNPGLSTR